MRLELHGYGDKRTVRRFALFPIRVKYEIRWLEMVTIAQYWADGYWHNGRFIDKEES
jgi:hypothetical protein